MSGVVYWTTNLGRRMSSYPAPTQAKILEALYTEAEKYADDVEFELRNAAAIVATNCQIPFLNMVNCGFADFATKESIEASFKSCNHRVVNPLYNPAAGNFAVPMYNYPPFPLVQMNFYLSLRCGQTLPNNFLLDNIFPIIKDEDAVAGQLTDV